MRFEIESAKLKNGMTKNHGISSMVDDWIPLDEAAEHFCPEWLSVEIEEIIERLKPEQRLPRNKAEAEKFEKKLIIPEQKQVNVWDFVVGIMPLAVAGINEAQLHIEIETKKRDALLDMLYEGKLIAIGFETEPTVALAEAIIPPHIFKNPKFIRPDTVLALGRKFEQVRVGLPEWSAPLDSVPAQQSRPQKRRIATFESLAKFWRNKEITENTPHKILCAKIRNEIGIEGEAEKGYSDATIIRHFKEFLKIQKLQK